MYLFQGTLQSHQIIRMSPSTENIQEHSMMFIKRPDSANHFALSRHHADDHDQHIFLKWWWWCCLMTTMMMMMFLIKTEWLWGKFPDSNFHKSANNKHRPISNADSVMLLMTMMTMNSSSPDANDKDGDDRNWLQHFLYFIFRGFSTFGFVIFVSK